MLQYALWTLSPGYNIEKGRGGRNVKIRDWKTHVFNETGLFRSVSTAFTHVCKFSDNSDSTILKFLKFLTKLLGKAIPYSTEIIKVWLETFVHFNCSVHWNKWPDPFKSTYTSYTRG